jgi:hypothetical protein
VRTRLDVTTSMKRRAEPVKPASKRRKQEQTVPLTSGVDATCSSRNVRLRSLSTLATMAFSTHLLTLITEDTYPDTMQELKMLPEHLLLKLWSQLCETWPGRMTHEFITDVMIIAASPAISLIQSSSCFVPGFKLVRCELTHSQPRMI